VKYRFNGAEIMEIELSNVSVDPQLIEQPSGRIRSPHKEREARSRTRKGTGHPPPNEPGGSQHDDVTIRICSGQVFLK